MAYFKLFFSPLFLSEVWGDFSLFTWGNLVELLEVNLTITWGLPYTWVALEVFSLRLVCTDPQALHQLLLRSQSPVSSSHRGFCKLWLPAVCPVSSPSGILQESWFFHLFSFLLVGAEWWLLKFLQADLQSPLHLPGGNNSFWHIFWTWFYISCTKGLN